MIITLTVPWANYAPGKVLPDCHELLARKLIAARMAVEGARPKAWDEEPPRPKAAPPAPAPAVQPPAAPAPAEAAPKRGRPRKA